MIKRKSAVFSMVAALGTLVAGGATALPQLPAPPGAPSAQDLADRARGLFFGAVEVVNDAEARAREAGQRANEARLAAGKRASDFASCPSPDAQALYDSIKQRRDAAERMRAKAADMRAKADAANAACHRSFQPESVCDALMSSYGWRGIEQAAAAEVTAEDGALTVLRSLECLTCNASGISLLVPDVSLTIGMVPAGPTPLPLPTGLRGVRAQRVSVGPAPKARVCTAWDPGSVSVTVDAGGGQISESARARLPHCTAEEEVGCAGFDPAKLLPTLVRLSIVPPQVTPGMLTITVPTRSARVVSGFSRPACAAPLRVCTRASASATFSLDPGRDAAAQLSSVASCQEWTEIGCAAPSFDLSPTYSDVQVPDARRVRVRWAGPGVRAGEVDVDVRGPDFDGACTSRPTFALPKLEVVTRRIDVPFVCRSIARNKLVSRT